MFEIPLLGYVKSDKEFDDWLKSDPLKIHFLGNIECEFILEEYAEDKNKSEFHEAIKNFLELDDSVLSDAEGYVFQYYKDILKHLVPEDDWYVEIESPKDVWKHVRFGKQPTVSRRYYGDKAVYISLECGCSWEQEHGLQIVFKRGEYINKVGGYDGHLTNSDAYADESLEDVVYK